MGKKVLPKLSPGNYEIMKHVWGKEKVTVRDIYEAIDKERDEKVGITSIKVQLARLETYGWLKKIKQGRNLYYSAAHGQDEAVDGLVEDLSKRVFNGSNVKLMKYLLDTKGITKEEIDDMRSMLDNYEEE